MTSNLPLKRSYQESTRPFSEVAESAIQRQACQGADGTRIPAPIAPSISSPLGSLDFPQRKGDSAVKRIKKDKEKKEAQILVPIGATTGTPNASQSPNSYETGCLSPICLEQSAFDVARIPTPILPSIRGMDVMDSKIALNFLKGKWKRELRSNWMKDGLH